MGCDDVLLFLRFCPHSVGPFRCSSLSSWQAVHNAFRGHASLKLLLQLELGDLELLDRHVLVEALEDVALCVKHGQNLSVHCGCFVVALGFCVGSVFLELAHELFVELGELEAVVEEGFGELVNSVGGLRGLKMRVRGCEAVLLGHLDRVEFCECDSGLVDHCVVFWFVYFSNLSFKLQKSLSNSD